VRDTSSAGREGKSATNNRLPGAVEPFTKKGLSGRMYSVSGKQKREGVANGGGKKSLTSKSGAFRTGEKQHLPKKSGQGGEIRQIPLRGEIETEVIRGPLLATQGRRGQRDRATRIKAPHKKKQLRGKGERKSVIQRGSGSSKEQGECWHQTK